MNNYNFPDPIKGLVIENEFTPEGSVRGLIKDNPELLADVEIITYARHRREAVTGPLTKDRNTIIVSSTFMYKDQLEEICKFMISLGRPIHCFVQYATQKLNDWLYEPSWNRSSFDDYNGFIAMTKMLVDKKLVYEICEDDDSKTIIHDDCHSLYGVYEDRDRAPWTLRLVLYSEEHEVFYRDNQDPADAAKWIERKKKNK